MESVSGKVNQWFPWGAVLLAIDFFLVSLAATIPSPPKSKYDLLATSLACAALGLSWIVWLLHRKGYSSVWCHFYNGICCGRVLLLVKGD